MASTNLLAGQIGSPFQVQQPRPNLPLNAQLALTTAVVIKTRFQIKPTVPISLNAKTTVIGGIQTEVAIMPDFAVTKRLALPLLNGNMGTSGTIVLPTATTLTLSGPTNCNVGQVSDPFTITPDSTLASTTHITITPSSGTCTPSTLTLSSANQTGTFTYTADTAGAKTISFTNDAGLTPIGIPFSVTAASSGGVIGGVPLTGQQAPTLNTRPFSPAEKGAVVMFSRTNYTPGNGAVQDYAWCNNSRYERGIRALQMQGTTWLLEIQCLEWYPSTSGTQLRFAGVQYTLKVRPATLDNSGTWINHQTINVTPNTLQRLTFTVRLTELNEGWYEFDIETYGAVNVDNAGFTETAVPYMAYVDRGGPVQVDRVPIMSGSYEVNAIVGAGVTTNIYWGCLPPGFPVARPITRDDKSDVFPQPSYPSVLPTSYPVTNFTTPSNVVRYDVVRAEHNVIDRHITRLPNGAMTTFNIMPYYWTGMIAKYPQFPIYGGPRGQSNMCAMFHVFVDRHGGAYGCYPWGVMRVFPDGTMRVRAGYEHRGPYARNGWFVDQTATPQQFITNQDVILRGDWSAIPASRWGFHECWGVAFDGRTVDVANLDLNAPTQFNPVNNANEHPHSQNPVAFVTDSQNNRVLKLEFTKDNFNAEPKVTEFIVYANNADPWDVAYDSGTIYVSERQNNRIAQYDATTGAFIRTLVSGPSGMGTVDSSRFPVLLTDQYSIQKQDCIQPEGIVIQDGWLYYGSITMRKVMKINLTTGQVLSTTQQKPQYINFVADSTAGSTVLTNVRSSSGAAPGGSFSATTVSIAQTQGRPIASTVLPQTFAIADPRAPTPITPIRGGEKVVSQTFNGSFCSTITLTNAATTTATGATFSIPNGDLDLPQVNPPGNTLTSYLKIAISDGTYYPRGTIFYTTWGQTVSAIRADTGASTPWTCQELGVTPMANVGYAPANGFVSNSYTAAVGVGKGRLYFGSSQQGFVKYSKNLPSDVAGDVTIMSRAYAKWQISQNLIVHGQDINGYFGYDLPYGQDPDWDYYMDWYQRS